MKQLVGLRTSRGSKMESDIEQVIRIAMDAGARILEVYDSPIGIEVQTKKDDSPLTKADLAAHDTITDGLLEIGSHIPIVSEEGRIGDPLESDLSWLVDPLDGTKEFIKRNGMFTVNIALMSRSGLRWNPILGVVHAPVTCTTWIGGKNRRAEKLTKNTRSAIKVNSITDGPTKLVASGSHRSDRDEAFASDLGPHILVRMGSSLKACVVAEGSADLYPRFGPTSCWDIAAAHAVVESAGGRVIGPDGAPLDYDLVKNVLNPYFLVSSSSEWDEMWVKNQS